MGEFLDIKKRLISFLNKLQYQNSFALLGIVFVWFSTLNFSGTGDVIQAFVPWIENANQVGYLENYQKNTTAYPPGYIFIPYLLHAHTPITPILAYKLFLLFSLASCHLIGRKIFGFRRVLVLDIFLIYPTMILGYGDSFLIALILLTFHFLNKQKFFISGISIAILIAFKFTPLIIFPPIFLYVFRTQNFSIKRSLINVNWENSINFVSGFILWQAPFIFFTGLNAYIENLKLALLNGYLSGNAMNIGWIITKFRMGSNSLPRYEEDSELIKFIYVDVHSGLYQGMKITAMTLIILIVIRSLKMENSIKNTSLLCSLSIYVYYIFAPGVHENHLTLAIPFCIILIDKFNLSATIIGILVGNLSLINLLAIYGLNGRYNEQRNLFGIDYTFFISLFEIFLALVILIFYFNPKTKLISRNSNGINRRSV